MKGHGLQSRKFPKQHLDGSLSPVGKESRAQWASPVVTLPVGDIAGTSALVPDLTPESLPCSATCLPLPGISAEVTLDESVTGVSLQLSWCAQEHPGPPQVPPP